MLFMRGALEASRVYSMALLLLEGTLEIAASAWVVVLGLDPLIMSVTIQINRKSKLL